MPSRKKKKSPPAPRAPGAVRVQLNFPADPVPAVADALRATARALSPGGEVVETTDAAPGSYSLTVHEGLSAVEQAAARAAAALAHADPATLAAFKAAIAAKENQP